MKSNFKKSILLLSFLVPASLIYAQVNEKLWSLSAAELISAGFQQIYNNKDLTDWDGPEGAWRIEDQALTWESTAENPLKDWPYLIWKGGQPENFELLVDFKLSTSANSGVNFRSYKLDDNWSLGGYQADITGDGRLTGTIYRDHPIRTRILRGQKGVESPDARLTIVKFADEMEILAKSFITGEWNTMLVVCNGPVITYYLNGVLVSELTDNGPDSTRKGYIGLQMHQGPPMKIQYKNIFLKTLK